MNQLFDDLNATLKDFIRALAKPPLISGLGPNYFLTFALRACAADP
jgi:hypothetical protein